MAKEKRIIIVARYGLKDRETQQLTGVVCYAVRSSSGSDTYCVRLQPGRPATCNCPGRTYRPGKACTHIQHCEALERNRREQRMMGAALNGDHEFSLMRKAS